MKLLSICLFTACLLWTSCDPCSDTACFSPPPPIQYLLVDSGTQVNLIANGTINPSDISITDMDGEDAEFRFVDSSIEVVNWTEGLSETSFKFLDEELFRVNMNSERVNEQCCSVVRVREFVITGTEFQSIDGNVFMIFVE